MTGKYVKIQLSEALNMTSMSRIPGLKDTTGMASRLPAPRVRRRLPSTPSMVNGGLKNPGNDEALPPGDNSTKLQNGVVTPVQDSVPPTCPPRLKKMNRNNNVETSIPKPKESSEIPRFSSPRRQSPANRSDVRKTVGRSSGETSSSSQARLNQSSTEDIKSQEMNSVSSSEGVVKDSHRNKPSMFQTRSSLVETISSSINKSVHESEETIEASVIPSSKTSLRRGGNLRDRSNSPVKSSSALNSYTNRANNVKKLLSEASDTSDNSKSSKLRSRSYSKERLKAPSAGKTSRGNSTERGRVNVRKHVSRIPNIDDSDSSECEPRTQAPPARTPRSSSLPTSQSYVSNRKSSLPRQVSSKRSLLPRSGSSQPDELTKRDTSLHRKSGPTIDRSVKDENSNVSEHVVHSDDRNQTPNHRKHRVTVTDNNRNMFNSGNYGSSEQIDSGINSSKDSDMPSGDVKLRQTPRLSSAGNVPSYNVVKLTDSMLSVYEIQEGDSVQSEKKPQGASLATNSMCSGNEAKPQVDITITPDSDGRNRDREVDSNQNWSHNEHLRSRTYSGGSMTLPSESTPELIADDELKSHHRHSWGDDQSGYVTNIPVPLNTWHGPDSDSSNLPNKRNLVGALDSSGASYLSSGESDFDKQADGSQGTGQLKSYLSTYLSQAKTQSPTQRQITVQTQENKYSAKPPHKFTSRIRPNSPSTRSPLLLIKPQMIRRNSFKERAAQERPIVKKSENRSRSPILATQGDRNSIASDTSESKTGKDSPRGSKIQTLASMFQGGKSKEDEFSLNSPRRTSSRESSPANFSDDSTAPKIPPKSPRNRSPVLAFPMGRKGSPTGRISKASQQESESESDAAAPALPPRKIPSPSSSPNTIQSSSNTPLKKPSSLPVSSRENSPDRKLFRGASKQNTHSRDNSPLSMLLSNNRKIQEASSMVFTPLRQNSNLSSAPSTPTCESEENVSVKAEYEHHAQKDRYDLEDRKKEITGNDMSTQRSVSQSSVTNKSLTSRGSSPVRASHTASFIAKFNVLKRNSSQDSEAEPTESSKEPASNDRRSLLYHSRSRIGGSRGSSPVNEESKIVPPRRPRSSPPVIVYKTVSEDEESQKLRQKNTGIRKSGIIPPRVTSPARSQEFKSGLVSPRIGSPARGPSPSSTSQAKTTDSKTGIKVLSKSSKLPFFMAHDKKPPLGRSVSKESKTSTEDSKSDSSFLLQVINRQDSVGDSDSSVGRDSQSSRKKSGILKQASDDSDGSDYSYGKGGRDSPSKKRVTFDKHIMEKEAKRELREARLKAELARFVTERKKQEALSKYSVEEPEGISGGSVSWDASMSDEFSEYFSGNENQDSAKELQKYLMLAKQQIERQSSDDVSHQETPLYSEIDKSKKAFRSIRQNELDTSASDQELAFGGESTSENEVEGDYVKLSDLECVMRSDSRNRSPYLSDSSDRMQFVGETDLDHINFDLDETDGSDHQGTTRPLRPGEVNGVDYTFLSTDDFATLEKSGNLLESGTYDGHKYGTPTPPREPQQPIRRSSSVGGSLTAPQPEPRRKRNRSIGESVMNKGDFPDGSSDPPVAPPSELSLLTSASSPSLGPLPSNWEMAYTEDGTPYFIDHITQRTQWQDPRFSLRLPPHRISLPPPRPLLYKPFYNSHSTETTHWLDPRLAKNQKTSPLECRDGELPYGWEKVEDPHYGTYFIDHVHRKTQYENPVNQAKRLQHEANTSPNYPVFTKDVDKLRGEFIKTQLTKSAKGFGFTILGGNEPDEQFLQIKNVVPGGAAFSDGKLSTGDVLVYVKGQCVLGYTHSDVVRLFQSINIGDKVIIEVCRGYELPFDPDTEIVTTLAVTSPQDNRIKNSPPAYPTNSRKSRDKFLHNNHNSGEPASSSLSSTSRPELLRVNIVKGALGFGFTIADSAYGQRVRQILDSDRCKTLKEGDILVEINQRSVKDMPHSDVVSVLKECPQGDESVIAVQRGGMLQPSKNRKPSGTKTSQSNEEQSKSRPSEPGAPRSAFFTTEEMEGGSLDEGFNNRDGPRLNESQDSGNVRQDVSDKPPDLVPYRSKTPTNDIGRGRSRSPGIGLAYSDKNHPALAGGSSSSQQNGYTNNSGNSSSNKGELSSSRSFGPADRQGEGSHLPTSTSARHRSRTPGPEFMRGSNRDDEQMLAARNSRDLQQRSKTPTFMHSSLSGTPDFIPASQYQSSNSSSSGGGGSSIGRVSHTTQELVAGNNRNYRTNTHHETVMERPPPPLPQTHDGTQQPYSSNMNLPPHPHHHHPELVNHSKSYNMSLSSAALNKQPYASGSAAQHLSTSNSSDMLKAPPSLPPQGRKQSTSFEYVDPRPSNLTRIPKLERTLGGVGGSDVLNRSRSPFDEERYVELAVQLEKQESGFGFRIIGGTEEGSQVSVGHIVPSGAADQDGGLRPGDEIVQVNGHLVVGSSHHKVVQLMGQAALLGTVALTVRRRLGQTLDLGSRGGGAGDTSYPYEVTVTRREMEGFGFVIISSVTRAGSVIGSIIEGSPAERCGRLHVGDRILAVNGTNITQSHHEDLVTLIKESGYSVTLTVGPPQDDASSITSHNSQRSSGQGSLMAYPSHSESDLSRRSDYSPHHGNPSQQQQILDKHREMARQRSQSSQQASPSSISEEDRFYQVELHRGSRGFGFSIRGGREFNNMPLFVLKVAPGGAADLDKRLKVGDQIMQINEFTTTNMTHAEAIDLIQNGGSTVKVIVKHTGKLPPQFGSSGVSSSSGIPVRTTTPTLTLPNGPITGGNPVGPLSQSTGGNPVGQLSQSTGANPVGPLSQSSPNPNRRPPETSYFQSNFPRY